MIYIRIYDLLFVIRGQYGKSMIQRKDQDVIKIKEIGKVVYTSRYLNYRRMAARQQKGLKFLAGKDSFVRK